MQAFASAVVYGDNNRSWKAAFRLCTTILRNLVFRAGFWLRPMSEARGRAVISVPAVDQSRLSVEVVEFAEAGTQVALASV
jgi:hypothetical protein